ncbi:CRISPR-associated protein Cas6 [Thermincola ferriacetica]|uniref:CRISPR-associated endoribonuclease n=1 Tax=Thermincola ferriacetica TaxID=281456 RepID=A0A0L6W228_9FIRM|nr:CRISPR-associated endoribonuclease Cas6 [Thermincola ferriacetica]KNZ69516.1 CRISPR-associated protein Cas6 [Thermincola ferriacetica]
MHICFSLRPEGSMEIPLQYNHIVQAAVYSSIDADLAAFLHDQGYQSGNRRFKLFAFSRLMGRFQIDKEKGTIRFFDEVRLVISSPVDQFCQSIANGMLTKGRLRLGTAEAEVEKLVVRQLKVGEERIAVRTLSPAVIRKTLYKPEGGRYSCYMQPGEPDYDTLLESNLRKKYEALYGQAAPEGNVKVRRLGRGDMRLVNYKNTVIKGYTGVMELSGPTELLQMAVDAGLGSKNSQGFGCVEVVER